MTIRKEMAVDIRIFTRSSSILLLVVLLNGFSKAFGYSYCAIIKLVAFYFIGAAVFILDQAISWL